jgi:N-acetylglucosaminyldiphosphoundecaprenol N-acetyl-beta-D-mannosaminyltransferase
MSPSRRILGIRINATTYADATRQILNWARAGESRYVCCAAVNNIIEARDSRDYAAVMEQADLVTSDGMPLVWTLRALGLQATRVYGPDLTPLVIEAAAREQIPVALYGGTPRVLARLQSRFEVAYAEAPPFRPPTSDEDARSTQAIINSGARIVFVGLGSPKQDRWMHAHRGKIPAVMIGVGAAFDFLAGVKPQAPRWMQNSGLEWLFRLSTEPRRLWSRYLKQNPRFAILALTQILRARLTA